jgi:opacity protein-like surface antigen
MFMRQMLRISATCLIVAIACVAVLTTDADAQAYTTSRPGGRAGTWDFFMPLTYLPSWSFAGPQGSSADLDATWGFGFGFGYNISDHFQMNGLFSWSARNYTVTFLDPVQGTRRYGNTEYSSTFSLNGIFYLLSGDISPFVSGGAGITYVDTSIPTGLGGPAYCWWDPWYGYVCDGGYPTKTETDVTYNLGIGVRFDLNRQFSLQPSYNRAWIDIDKAGTPGFDIWRLDFIFRM